MKIGLRIRRFRLLLKSWKALFSYTVGNSEKAIREFEECIQLDPENGINLKTLGRILFTKGYFSESLRKFQDALKYMKTSDRSTPEVYAYMAYSCQELGKYDESITFYGKAIDSWKKDDDFKKEDLYYGLGRSYLYRKQYNEAISVLNKALALKEKNALAHLGLSVAYAGILNHEKSLYHLVTAIGLDSSLEENETVKTLKKDLGYKLPTH